jgi:imidazolonepropionase-like amidohydrolase
MVRAPLEPGAPADLVALGSSPLDDLAALGDVRMVIRAGRLIDRG